MEGMFAPSLLLGSLCSQILENLCVNMRKSYLIFLSFFFLFQG